MEAELKILSIIGENGPNITQRDLSAQTDLSLGAVNLLIKKMIEKGLVKIEKLQPRTVQYLLTPKGMMEKARKTYDYLKRTYESILTTRGALVEIVEGLPDNGVLYLYGAEDEVYSMISLLLNEITKDKNIAVKKIKTESELSHGSTVIVWSAVDRDKLTGVNCINLLHRVI